MFYLRCGETPECFITLEPQIHPKILKKPLLHKVEPEKQVGRGEQEDEAPILGNQRYFFQKVGKHGVLALQ